MSSANPLRVIAEQIPIYLRIYALYWCVWVRTLRENDPTEKPSKYPISPRNGSLIRVNKPEEWTDFDTALRALNANPRYCGLGVLLVEGSGIVGIDLDDAIDNDGNLKDWARTIVGAIPSYWERSPSGMGLRSFVLGVIPDDAPKRLTLDDGAIEVYVRGRYLTITGRRLEGSCDQLTECQEGLDLLIASLRENPGAEATASAKEPAAIAPILRGCSWIRHCREDSASLPEPEWYAMLSILGRCRDGLALAHQWSRPYPRYSPEETEAKLNQALKASGPVTCLHIAGSLGQSSLCSSCPNHGKVRSPIVLGNRNGVPPKPKPQPRLEIASNDADEVTTSQDVERRTLPVIEVNNRELRDASRDSLLALRAANDPPTIYVRSGQMVNVMADEVGRHGIREVTESYLRGRLTRSANFRRVWRDRAGNRMEVASSPPLDVVRDLLALDPKEWDLPPLESVSEAPIIRPDGSLLVVPGYDRATSIVYAPPLGFRLSTLPAVISRADIEAAVALLYEMLAGFPFVDPASKANFIALLLTILLRRAIEGKVPVALIDAPAAGTGKSLLAEIVALIHTGTNACMKPCPAKDDEEMRKTISAVLANGHVLTIFDNIVYRLDSAALALAVTASTWTDRLLGQTKVITLPQRTTWVVTGNNIALGGDMPRRCYWIRLDAKMYQPWQRSEFRIPDLLQWVRDRRGELLSALLTIAKAWYDSGKPETAAPSLGSFQEWANTVAAILDHAGIFGFLRNMEDLYSQSDPTDQQWEIFLAEVYERFSGRPFTVAQLVSCLRENDDFHQLIPDDLIDEDRKGNLFQRKVGMAFRQRVERRYGAHGIHLTRSGADKSAKVLKWAVKYSENPPDLPPPPPAPGSPVSFH